MQRNDKKTRTMKNGSSIGFNRGLTPTKSVLQSSRPPGKPCEARREGDAMLNKATVPTCEASDLAFAHWQQYANEKAYAAKLITKAMYEFARDEIHKTIACLSEMYPKEVGCERSEQFCIGKTTEVRYNV